ncbi:hypothetical protein K2X33_10715 [bacterium]|nr:hypothetical protein [bacterium]
MSQRHVMFCVIALSISSLAFGSLKDKKEQEAGLANIKDQITAAEKTCGAKFSMDISWGTFGEKIREGANYCGSVVDGLSSLCGAGADEKKAVANAIKKVTCKFKAGMGEGDKFATTGLAVKGGSLEAQYDWDTANISDTVKEFLMKKLD